MPILPPPGLPPADAAVLLVLLPLVSTRSSRQVQATTRTMLDELQHRLGAAVKILVVAEENDPAVVRSFRVAGLPSFLLLRQGIELWRQPGLPQGELIVEQLLHHLYLASDQPTPDDGR